MITAPVSPEGLGGGGGEVGGEVTQQCSLSVQVSLSVLWAPAPHKYCRSPRDRPNFAY